MWILLFLSFFVWGAPERGDYRESAVRQTETRQSERPQLLLPSRYEGPGIEPACCGPNPPPPPRPPDKKK